MRTGQDGKRSHPLWVLLRDLPSEAGTPIMANKMEPPMPFTDMDTATATVPTPFRQGGDAVPGVRSNTPSVQIPSLWPLAIIGSPSRPRTILLFTSIRVCAAHHDTDGVPVTRFTSLEVW
jgi:hypothetical protein